MNIGAPCIGSAKARAIVRLQDPLAEQYMILMRLSWLNKQSTLPKAAFILILRRQNQRFETPIQNADPKRR